MANRAPGLREELARRTLQHLLGTGRWWSLVLAVLFLVMLGWFTDSLFEWLTDAGLWLKGRPPDDWAPYHRLLAVAIFVGYVGLLLWLARKARVRLRARVRQDDEPAQARGLVLFLSPLTAHEATAVQRELDSGLPGLEAFRERFGRCSWRMPIEAFAYHRRRLRHVLVLASSDRPPESGSVGQLSLFRDLARTIFPSADLRVESLEVCDARYAGGVDFEDMGALSEAVDDAYEYLLRQGLRAMEVLIDVTGGQKPTAVAGAAVALAEGRCLQYVSTRDYRVRVYDVTYGD
jgi:hypothetical protein